VNTLAVPTDPLPAGASTGVWALTTSRLDCAWSLGNSSTWLQLTPTNGTGNLSVSYIALANQTQFARTASLTLIDGAQPYEVRQLAEESDLTPPDIYGLSAVQSGNSGNYTFTARTHATDVATTRFWVDTVRITDTCCYTGKRSVARGAHVFRVQMVDLSGNTAEATLSFVRK
jgi:hypothetical protein